MKTLTIKLSDKDHDLLQRIAEADDRRLADLSYLLLARGLECFYCETIVSIPMRDDEIPQEKKDQISKNKELMGRDDWQQLSWDERREQGFDHVSTQLHNGDLQPGGDQLIDPLAKRITAMATDANADQ
jgi:hypothetical protein